jgi:hypothetical protein
MEEDRMIDPVGVRNNAPDRRVSGLTDEELKSVLRTPRQAPVLNMPLAA